MIGDVYSRNGVTVVVLEESQKLDVVLYMISHQIGREVSSYITHLDSISRFKLLVVGRTTKV